MLAANKQRINYHNDKFHSQDCPRISIAHCRDERIFLTRLIHEPCIPRVDTQTHNSEHLLTRPTNFLSFLIHSSLYLCTNERSPAFAFWTKNTKLLSHSPQLLALGRSFSYVFRVFSSTMSKKFSFCRPMKNSACVSASEMEDKLFHSINNDRRYLRLSCGLKRILHVLKLTEIY